MRSGRRHPGVRPTARVVCLLCGLLAAAGRLVGEGTVPGGDASSIVLVVDCAGDPEACVTVRTALALLDGVPRRHRTVSASGAAELAVVIAGTGAPRVLGVLEVVSPSASRVAATEGRATDGPVRSGVELARTGGRRELTPAWLVDAALRAGATVGLAPVVEPAAAPWGQGVARMSRPAVQSMAEAALATGVPAIRLVVPPGEAAAAWVSAMVRRLDALRGRPRPETEYLAAGGRVWTRPALYWLGGLLWVTLVVTGRPGVWRRTAAERRRLQGRRYLRGLPLRVSFVAALVWSPALALPLLGPAAVTALRPGRSAPGRLARRVIALAPVTLLLAATATAVASGEVVANRPGPTALLLALALAARELTARRPPTDR